MVGKTIFNYIYCPFDFLIFYRVIFRHRGFVLTKEKFWYVDLT